MPIPSYQSLKSYTPKTLTAGLEDKTYITSPGGIIIPSTERDGGSTDEEWKLRAGFPMAYNATTDRWVLLKRTTTTTTGTVTSVVLVNSHAFKVNDTISIGADTGINIDAINYTTHTITIASTTVASGEAVVVVGEETFVGFLAGQVSVKDEQLPAGSQFIEVNGELVIGGLIDEAQVLGDLAAIKADSDSAKYLRNFQFRAATGLVEGV